MWHPVAESAVNVTSSRARAGPRPASGRGQAGLGRTEGKTPGGICGRGQHAPRGERPVRIRLVEIRRAAAAEMDEVGDIRIAAYVRGGYLSEDSGYVPTLRGLGAHRDGEVFVAVVPSGDDERPAERIVGTIMLQPWPHAGEVVTEPDEAEIRALAVRPEAQGQGVGKQLLAHVLRH